MFPPSTNYLTNIYIAVIILTYIGVIGLVRFLFFYRIKCYEKCGYVYINCVAKLCTYAMLLYSLVFFIIGTILVVFILV